MTCLIHGPTQNCYNGKYRIFLSSGSQIAEMFLCLSRVCTSFQSLTNMVDVLNFFTLKSLVFLFLFAFFKKKKIPSAFSSIYLLSFFPHFISVFLVLFILGTSSRSRLWSFIDAFCEEYELQTHQRNGGEY